MAAGAQTQRRRQGLIIALSGLAHVVVLSMMGFNAAKLAAPFVPEAAPVNIWLAPRLTRQIDSANDHHPSNAAAPIASSKPKAAPAPAPSPTLSAALSAPTVVNPGAPNPSVDAGQGVSQALRSRIGCDLGSGAHLTAEEKDRCSQHFAETARLGPKFIDTIPPEKRAYYDAVQAATEASRHPEAPYYRDANGNIQTWGHPPAVGCTFKGHFKPGASLSDKIKATGMIGVPLGPLSCGVQLPQGSMTPELGIPTP